MHLRDKGYEFDRNEGGKYPKIKPKDGKQWTRIYNLGEDYSLASIDKTIEANYWKGLCGYASYVGKIKSNNIRNLRHPPRQHWLYAPERDYGPLLTLVLTFVYLLGGPDLITPYSSPRKFGRRGRVFRVDRKGRFDDRRRSERRRLRCYPQAKYRKRRRLRCGSL